MSLLTLNYNTLLSSARSGETNIVLTFATKFPTICMFLLGHCEYRLKEIIRDSCRTNSQSVFEGMDEKLGTDNQNKQNNTLFYTFCRPKYPDHKCSPLHFRHPRYCYCFNN